MSEESGGHRKAACNPDLPSWESLLHGKLLLSPSCLVSPSPSFFRSCSSDSFIGFPYAIYWILDNHLHLITTINIAPSTGQFSIFYGLVRLWEEHAVEVKRDYCQNSCWDTVFKVETSAINDGFNVNGTQMFKYRLATRLVLAATNIFTSMPLGKLEPCGP